MTIYKVTTEGDCEGRSTKILGYVEASSPQHAVKYLKSIGKNAYYLYWIEEVKDLVIQASPEDTLEGLDVTLQKSVSGWYGKVAAPANEEDCGF